MTTRFEYRDAYSGWTPAKVEAFKTSRKGAKVERYRIVQANGQGCGIAAAFISPEAAIGAMRRYPAVFREVAA